MAPRPPRRKGKSPRTEPTVSGLQRRIDGIKQLRAAAERTGSEQSAELLEQVLLDLERLEQFERAKHGAGDGHGEAKFGPKLCSALIGYVREGMWLSHAADLCHVSRQAVHRWVREGWAEPSGPYGAFARELTAARTSQTHKMWTTAIEQSLKDRDPTVLLRLLEKWDPAHFGQRQKIEIDIEGAKERLLDIAKRVLPVDSFETLLGALERDGESLPQEDES